MGNSKSKQNRKIDPENESTHKGTDNYEQSAEPQTKSDVIHGNNNSTNNNNENLPNSQTPSLSQNIVNNNISNLKSSADRIRTLKVSYDKRLDPSLLTFWVSARTGNLQKLKYYVEECKQNVNELDEYGNTAMYYSCLCHHSKCLEYLLENGAVLDALEGERCWLVANLPSIRDLLRRHNSRIGKSGKTNGFFSACWGGDIASVCSILKDPDFSVNIKNRNGLFGLDYAIFRGHKELENVLRTKFGAYRSLTSDMKKLLQEGFCSDLVWNICDLEGKQRTIHLHKIVLNSRIPQQNFDKLKELNLVEEMDANQLITKSQPNNILHYATAMELLDFVYCGTINRSTEYAAELSVLAEYLQLPSLDEALKNEKRVSGFKTLQVSSSLANDFRTLINKEENSDVTFVVQGTEFYAHKTILCARSDYFKALWLGNFTQNNNQQVVDDTTPEGFLLLLEFVYTDTIEAISEKITSDNALDLIPLANRWLLEPLKVFCETILTTEFSIDAEDAATLYLFAEEHNCQEFKKNCLKLMLANAPIVVTSEDFELLPQDLQNRLLKIAAPKKTSKESSNKGASKSGNWQRPESFDPFGNKLEKGDKALIATAAGSNFGGNHISQEGYYVEPVTLLKYKDGSWRVTTAFVVAERWVPTQHLKLFEKCKPEDSS